MRLLLISQDFPPDIGGIQTYCYELSDRFAQYNDYFSVIAPQKKTAQTIDSELPYKVHRIISSNSMLPYTSMPAVKSLIISKKIDTTFHAQWQTVISALGAKKRGDINRIFAAAHGRELLFNPFKNDSFAGRKYVTYRRWLLSKVDHFFAVSRYTADLLIKEGVEKKRITVMPNGTNPQQFFPVSSDKLRDELDLNDRPVVMTITRLVPRKGVDTSIRAMKEVISDIPDALYLIVGDGEDMARLQSIVKEMNLEDNVRFLGRVPHNYVNEYYNLCDVFVMTPRTESLNIEGFGIVYLEANACGKPVIGSKSGGIPDAIVDGETGILVDEDEPVQLAKAIVRLLNDKELARKMGKNGRQRVNDETNWDIIAKKIHKKMIELSII